MPSPKDALKTSAKKSPEATTADLGQTLAKRKSQDFKAKIAGWNETGAGIAQPEDGILAAGEASEYAERVVKATEKAVEDRKKSKKLKADIERIDDKENATPTTPKTPKTPATGDKGVAKQVSAR